MQQNVFEVILKLTKYASNEMLLVDIGPLRNSYNRIKMENEEICNVFLNRISNLYVTC